MSESARDELVESTEGEVQSTGRYRLKVDEFGLLGLQHLVIQVGGDRRRWVTVKTALSDQSDDEP